MEITIHDCHGAECPHCAPLPVGRIAWSPVADKSPRDLSALAPLRRAMERQKAEAQLDEKRAIYHGEIRSETQEKLITFRDSIGQIPASYPTVVVPSTTIVLRRVSKEGWGEVLVHQRADNGWWGFIGGRQEVGESIQECAIREAKEESGYDVVIERLICVDSDPTHHVINSYQDKTVQYCNITFSAMISGGEFALSAESQAHQWLPIKMGHIILPEPFLPAHVWRFRMCLAVMMGCGAQAR